MPYPIPSSVLKIIFIVRKMTLELKSKTTNPKSGKVNEISQRYSVDIYFIISFLFVSTCVWSTHMYLGVCVSMCRPEGRLQVVIPVHCLLLLLLCIYLREGFLTELQLSSRLG